MVALVPAVAQADVLGAFDAWELYAALIVDAETRDVACRIQCCAGHDQRVTARGLVELTEILELNHPRVD